MTRNLLLLSLPIAALALTGCPTSDDTGCDTGTCGDGGGADGGGSDGGSDGGGGDTTVTVTSSSSGLTLTIENGAAGGYKFGIAETDSASSDPWTGEDCYLGYTTGSGTLYEYCHPASDGSNGFSKASGLPLDEATETLFDNSFDGVLTFYLEDLDTGDCWVWGQTPGYFTALGCTEI